MSYSRRWAYAGCCVMIVIGIGYFFDLQYLLEKYTQLVRTERELRTESDVHHSADNKVFSGKPVIVQSQYLSSLFQLLQKHHIDLISVVRVDQADAAISDAEEYQLVLRGEYMPLRRVFLDFMSQTKEYVIKNVVLQLDATQHVQVELTLRLQEKLAISAIRKFKPNDKITNPFCGMQQRVNTENTALSFSLRDMQLLGFVSRHQLRSAIIRFPDGMVEEVGIGARLGKEGGQIEKINSRKITVLLPDQTRVML